jgi:hypothetical protein
MVTGSGGNDWVMDNTRFAWYDCLTRSEHSRYWCGSSGGILWYRVIDPLLATHVSGETPPQGVTLVTGYPNPFNAMAVFSISIPQSSIINLTIYDLVGREVATLVNEWLAPGEHTRQWDAAGMPSGVYFYRLNAGSFVQTKKLVLLR